MLYAIDTTSALIVSCKAFLEGHERGQAVRTTMGLGADKRNLKQIFLNPIDMVPRFQANRLSYCLACFVAGRV